MESRDPLTPSTTTANVLTDTPSLPTKRSASALTPRGSRGRQRLDFDKENELRTEMSLHPHEESQDYFLRVKERGGNGNRDRWEDCRVLTKYKVAKANGREQVFCTIECRLREDLQETTPWRPAQSMRYVCIRHVISMYRNITCNMEHFCVVRVFFFNCCCYLFLLLQRNIQIRFASNEDKNIRRAMGSSVSTSAQRSKILSFEKMCGEVAWWFGSTLVSGTLKH